MRKFLVAVPVCAMLMVTATANAQDRESAPEGDAKSAVCNAALNFPYLPGTVREWTVCLSSEGNVVNMIAPNGVNHSFGWEGYRICTATGQYWDLGAQGQSGFGPATVTQPSGPGQIIGLTITRTSTDGQWLLTQKFAKDNAERDFTITMLLKRLGGPVSAAPGVYLQRWSDLNVDASFGGDVTDKSAFSLYARQIRAIALTAYTFTPYPISNAVGPYPFGAGDCTAPGVATPAAAMDASGRQTYHLGGFNTNQQKTVKFRWAVQ